MMDCYYIQNNTLSDSSLYLSGQVILSFDCGHLKLLIFSLPNENMVQRLDERFAI